MGELLGEEKVLAAQIERLEREVEKARGAGSALEGARALLQKLREKVEADPSWATRRRVVEALVAGVTIESHRDVGALRGKGRTHTLHLSYRFEVPLVEDAAPRTAKTQMVPSSLGLQRMHAKLCLAVDAHGAAREAARELLRTYPTMQAKEVMRELGKRGLSISPASVSRLRHALKKGANGPGAATP